MSIDANAALAAADRDRRRHLATLLANPYDQSFGGMSTMPGWSAFFGSLQDKADDAAANGMGSRTNFGSLLNGIPGGAGAFSEGPGGVQYPSDSGSVAKNQILSQMADQNRARKQADAGASIALQEDAAAGLRKGYNENLIANAALGVDLNTPDGQKTFLSRLSPDLRAPYAEHFAGLDLAQRKQAESEAAQAEAVRAHKAEEGLQGAQLAETVRKNKFEEGGLDVAGNVKTTLSGKPYLDLGDYATPSAREQARRRAQAQGIKAVSPEVGSSLAAADTARQNINAMWSQIESKLPKDPTGRLIAGPANKLSQYFQNDADLAAFNSWRAGAIQAVQALVEKGMGFRLNQAEINMIMQNDMPQVTDTVDTARRRINNVLTLLQNKENSALQSDRSTLPGGSASSPSQEAPAGRSSFSVKDPNGGTHYFDSQAKADAFKKAAGIQ